MSYVIKRYELAEPYLNIISGPHRLKRKRSRHCDTRLKNSSSQSARSKTPQDSKPRPGMYEAYFAARSIVVVTAAWVWIDAANMGMKIDKAVE